jgi:phenylacetate-coenzyme A ligase PaaK-like adenylate-forming protein
MQGEWKHKILNVTNSGFESLALGLFQFQYKENPVYQAYVKALRVDPGSVNSISSIPFLPIHFFKSHEIKTAEFDPEVVFESSGTTGSINSRHLVKDKSWYTEVFTGIFEKTYGTINEYCILGLLPSYLERNNSSLVYMVNSLVERSNHPQSGFYLDEHEKLFNVLSELEKQEQKTILVGVTFGLLDFAEKYSLKLKNTIIMETGGMKGRREEMIREDVHAILKDAFGVPVIHSEYGMTELLSQAYSKGNGIFKTPQCMKVLVRDDEDPLLVRQSGNGLINVIDLANIYSCCFIATDDIGKLYADGSFEVLGRMDGSDLRGCSLLAV